MQAQPLKLAVSKGRILTEALPLLEAIGIAPLEDPEQSRKLILPTRRSDVELVIVRANDVPTYVEYGGADLGIAGKDVLLEHEGSGLYEPLDLGIGRCRLVVAGRSGNRDAERRLRVATKYAKTARRYFAEKGLQVQVIKLYGSMELAPLTGLADLIVDLVDTGNTLRANGLRELETIMPISSRLVISKSSMVTKHVAVKGLSGSFAEVVRARSRTAR